MIFNIKHKTIFSYNNAPLSAIQKLRLTPMDQGNQKIINWDIDVNGCTIELETYDFQGNKIHLCKTINDTKKIEITSYGRLEIEDTNGIVGPHKSSVPIDLFKFSSSKYTYAGPHTKKLVSDLFKDINKKTISDLELLNFLSKNILIKVKYLKGKTNIKTTAEDSLGLGYGVCQDHVHIFLASTRLLGYPSRYVSGYLMLNDINIQEASHAWAEVYIENLGWVGFDISNSISPDDKYVKLAIGFDYIDVIPISGIRVGESDEKIKTNILIESKQ
tara:strand:- start:296 stop:1117 length:822 start_codon:yes stop_codon:yes gene_type:complete